MSLVLPLALLTLATAQDPAPFAPAAVPIATPTATPTATPEFQAIALQYSVASEVAAVVETAVADVKVLTDPRTNSLLVMGSPKAVSEVKDVVAAVDVELLAAPEDELFAPATADLVVPAGDGNQWSLMALVDEYGRLTDQHFVISPETRNFLESTQTGLTRSVVVPKSEVQSFFESLLVQMDFVVTVRRSADPRLLAIESLSTGSRTTIRNKAIYVRQEDLGRYAKHPSLLVTTVVTLPNSDVRQLSNSMRTMITDANTQQMLPAGNSNSMVLTGFAPAIDGLAQLLKLTDQASKIDRPQPTFARFPLEKAVADEVAGMIEELVEASHRGHGAQAQTQGAVQTQSSVSVRVMADSRTNSLIVMALAADMEKVEQLVGLLDQ